jgi:hypothetical protein
MKGVLGLLLQVLLFSTSSAQVITANDSVSTLPGCTQMVFYNLSTGAKTVAPDTAWHIAVSIRHVDYPYNTVGATTIRFNEASGMKLFIAPNADTSTFETLDTTGWRTWHQLHDSDSSIDNGAFNSTRNLNADPPFDYGWGMYNDNNHNVIGDSVFLIVLPNGQFKKFIVAALVYDTMWVLKYENLDNSQLDTAFVDKNVYTGKEFVYLNLQNNSIYDFEPPADEWDLEFLRYAVPVSIKPDEVLVKTGVWTNKGETVAIDSGVNISATDYSTLSLIANTDAIGWNWEIYNPLDSQYTARDSLVYFVQTLNGAIYKMIYTGYGGLATGVISFYQKQLSYPSAINSVKDKGDVELYPVPAANYLHIAAPGISPSVFKIFDMSGKLINSFASAAQTTGLNTASLDNGMYLLSAQQDGLTYFKRFIVSH